MSLVFDAPSFVFGDADVTEKQKIDIPGSALPVHAGKLRSKSVIIHDLPITGFLTKSIHEFLKTIITLKIWNLETVQIAGVSFSPDHFSVAYEMPDGFRRLTIDEKDEELKKKVVCECVRVVGLLHAVGFTWNHVKPTSIYVDSEKNVRFCCFMPFPLTCPETEDEFVSNAPEYPLKLDILQIGLLVWELWKGVDQKSILDRIWNMEVAEDDVWHNVLVSRCLSLVPPRRPDAAELCKTLGVAVEKRERAPESFTVELLDKIGETVLAKLIKGNEFLEQKKFDEARRCYEGLNSPVALNNLALLMQKSDPKRSTELMIQAADAGYCVAQKNASICYSKGIGVEKDIDQAKKYMKGCSDQGYFEGQRLYWQLLRKYLDSDFMAVLELCARKGDNKSILLWAGVLKNGYGDNQVDLDKSQWLFMNQTAYDSMGYLFLAKGCQEDRQQAFNHMKKAAEETKCAQAYFELGVMYLKGFNNGVRDTTTAIKMMQKAADLNLPEAMFNIALCKRWGIDMPKDEVEAFRMCARAQDIVMRDFLCDENRGKYIKEFWRSDGFNGE